MLVIRARNKTPITCFGIAPWGVVTGGDILADAGGEPVAYNMEKEPSKGQIYLDPNHTHHLLVDDGSEGKFGKEIEFRAKLEAQLTRRCESTATTAPIVNIIIEGGPNSLHTVAEALKSGTPSVILKGTGRAADVISQAYSWYQDWMEDGKSLEEFKQNKSESLNKVLSDKLALKDENQQKKYLNILLECFDHMQNLHIFEVCDINNNNNNEDLRATSLAIKIVDAFLEKDQRESQDVQSLLRSLGLSFQWSHREAAKKILDMAKDKRLEFDASGRNCLFVQAIEDKKLDFIDLFKDQMVDLKGDEAEITTLLFDLGDQSKKCSIDEKMSHIIGSFWSTKSQYKSSRASLYVYMFIYAVQRKEMNLAWFFLKKTTYPIACALIGCNILKQLTMHELVGTDDEFCKTHSQEFENVAYSLISDCAQARPIRTRFILLQEIPTLGSVSVLQLAIQGDCLKFISHKVCQDMFQQMWFGGLSPKNSWWRVNIANLIVPLAPWLCKYEAEGEEDVANHEFMTDEKLLRKELGALMSIGIDVGLRKSLSYKERCLAFLDAPCIKFGHSIYSYIVLLIFFSILIMEEADHFESGSFQCIELTVYLFFAHFILQEWHQVMANGNTNSTWAVLFRHIMNHLKDIWNVMDAMIIIMIIVAACLRFAEINTPTSIDGVPGLRIKIMYCIIYFLLWLRMLHIFMLTSFLGPKLVMIQMMLKDLVYISFCFLILGTSYSILSYSLQASLAHECCQAHEAGNYSSVSTLMQDIFDTSWWNLFGEVGDPYKNVKIKDGSFYEFMAKILLPGLKGFYMLISGIVLLNLLIAMFSHSFTSIQDQSYRIWCFSKHDLIFEYYDRSKIPAPLAIVSLIKRCMLRRRCCRRFKKTNKFISSKRTFKVRLQTEGKVWSDEGKWAIKFAKTLKRWEEIIASNYWLTHNDKTEDEGKWTIKFAKTLKRWEEIIASNYWPTHNDRTDKNSQQRQQEENSIAQEMRQFMAEMRDALGNRHQEEERPK